MQTKRRRRVVSSSKKRTTRVTVDFPQAQHRKLKAMAALEGVSLQEFIRSRVVEDVEGENVLDSELKPILRKILEDNKEVLKRLADK